LSDDESRSGDHDLYESDGKEGFEDVNDISFDDDASSILDDLGKSGKKSGSIPNLDAKLLEEAKRDCSALPYQKTELLCICAIPWISR
jgi:hypothetical protein